MMTRTTNISLGIALIVCVGTFLVWWFLFGHINTIRESLVEQLSQIAAAEQARTSQAKLAAAVASSQLQRTAIAALYLHRDDVITFLTTLESFASNDVSVTVKTLNEVTAASGPQLHVPLGISGSATAVQGVLTTLESLPYASYIDNVQVTISVDEFGEELYDASVTVVVALDPQLYDE